MGFCPRWAIISSSKRYLEEVSELEVFDLIPEERAQPSARSILQLSEREAIERARAIDLSKTRKELSETQIDALVGVWLTLARATPFEEYTAETDWERAQLNSMFAATETGIQASYMGVSTAEALKKKGILERSVEDYLIRHPEDRDWIAYLSTNCFVSFLSDLGEQLSLALWLERVGEEKTIERLRSHKRRVIEINRARRAIEERNRQLNAQIDQLEAVVGDWGECESVDANGRFIEISLVEKMRAQAEYQKRSGDADCEESFNIREILEIIELARADGRV